LFELKGKTNIFKFILILRVLNKVIVTEHILYIEYLYLFYASSSFKSEFDFKDHYTFKKLFL